jgi:hypothetical protein
LFPWHFQPLTSPQALNALVIDLPTGISQQNCDPTVSISTMLSHQLDHVRHQALFICAPPWLASLCRSVLAKYLTDPTLRYLQLATHMINADPTTRGA